MWFVHDRPGTVLPPDVDPAVVEEHQHGSRTETCSW